jgi:hypothetical protein
MAISATPRRGRKLLQRLLVPLEDRRDDFDLRPQQFRAMASPNRRRHLASASAGLTASVRTSDALEKFFPLSRTCKEGVFGLSLLL